MEAGVSIKQKTSTLELCKCSKRTVIVFTAAFFISIIVGASFTVTPPRSVSKPPYKHHLSGEAAPCPPCHCEKAVSYNEHAEVLQARSIKDRSLNVIQNDIRKEVNVTTEKPATRYVYPTKYRPNAPTPPPPYSPRVAGQDPRVLCMVFTTPGAWETKAKAVNNTWGKRCHKLHYFYSQGETELKGAIPLGVPEGRGHLTAKTRLALDWAYFHYSDSVDWFLKADDDVYIIMENLLEYLQQYDPARPYYLGKNSGPWGELKHGYCSGGAGYLLSNQALRKFLAQAEVDMMSCKPDGGFEDADIGACLASMGIYPENSLDQEGRIKFHSDNPLKVLEGRDNGYFIKIHNVQFGNPEAMDRMMSPDAISFHYISPAQMYMYDYLLYDVKRH